MFREAVSRASRIISYMGMIIGRPQRLLDMTVNFSPDDTGSGPLTVHWNRGPRRDPSVNVVVPQSADKLLDAIANPGEFGSVLQDWLTRDGDWKDARTRFFSSFDQQRFYDINRLIGSANMFDILPDSAVPANLPVSDDLKSAQACCRVLFRALPQSPERDSVLGALGRMGKSTLKQKVRHRGRYVVRSCGEWFPELELVLDEAVNCRNFFVHGGESRFDYGEHASAITFFIDTLEFVFAASDLIEAGWDAKAWILRRTSMTHPYGAYRVNYSANLNALRKALESSQSKKRPDVS